MGKRVDNTVCHCLKMRRSAENVIHFYDKILAPTGLTVRQYSLLYQILGHEGCNVRELSELTELDRSTLARSLKPLVNTGLIEDIKDTGTRNSKLVLTEQGKEVCSQANHLWCSAQEQFEKRLGTDTVNTLEKILETIQEL